MVSLMSGHLHRPLHVIAVIEPVYIILYAVQKSECTLKMWDEIEHLIWLHFILRCLCYSVFVYVCNSNINN